MFPDLLLIDGGKGQLNAALAAFREQSITPPTLVSLAKRDEEIFLPGESEPLRLSRHAFALRLLQYVRDEAHRFAQHYHHILRKKSTLGSAHETDRSADRWRTTTRHRARDRPIAQAARGPRPNASACGIRASITNWMCVVELHAQILGTPHNILAVDRRGKALLLHLLPHALGLRPASPSGRTSAQAAMNPESSSHA